MSDKKKKQKFYVVWSGVQPGVYDSWSECRRQVVNYPGARYKSFETREAAESALAEGAWAHIGRQAHEQQPDWKHLPAEQQPVLPSLSVDAACSGTPGPTEYRGVLTHSGEQLFHVGPLTDGNNNIGEFLALVHGLALLQKQGFDSFPIYSDSRTARSWVRKRHADTKLQRTERNAQVFELIRRAEQWLQSHEWHNPILTWQTDQWGEIPADFGRK
ncbi:MAG: ribonuclease H family protein [Paludibacteraceae bacterium]|nr:ribonuclease H family protein [Paludibacteraceae bacterium]